MTMGQPSTGPFSASSKLQVLQGVSHPQINALASRWADSDTGRAWDHTGEWCQPSMTGPGTSIMGREGFPSYILENRVLDVRPLENANQHIFKKIT